MLAARSKGFTLIELMIAVAITTILLSIAVPSFRDTIKRVSIRSAADAVLTGLRTAQAEAIRQNVKVDFRLTAGTVTSTSPPTSAVKTGPNWLVRLVTGSVFVRGHNMAESGSNVTVNAKYKGVRFTGLGQATRTNDVALPAPYWVVLKDPDLSYSRCVYVTPGGAVRVCDPAITTGPTACVPVLTSADCI